jgi:hypothetical protein
MIWYFPRAVIASAPKRPRSEPPARRVAYALQAVIREEACVFTSHGASTLSHTPSRHAGRDRRECLLSPLSHPASLTLGNCYKTVQGCYDSVYF